MSDISDILGVRGSPTGINALDIALPVLQADAEAQLRTIENKVSGLLSNGKLTADLALQSWIEYITVRNQINRLSSRVKAASNRK